MIARLLHYANASPPSFELRRDFYALKERLLRKHGTPDGADVQHIEGKVCWSCGGDGMYDEHDYCWKCDGTGWYKSPRWIALNRYRFGGFMFHVPGEVSYLKPEPDVTRIEGRIEHADYGDKSITAFVWLCLLCGEWRMVWKWLRASRRCYWWRCHPWFWLQAAVTAIAWRLDELRRESLRREDDQDVPF